MSIKQILNCFISINDSLNFILNFCIGISSDFRLVLLYLPFVPNFSFEIFAACSAPSTDI